MTTSAKADHRPITVLLSLFILFFLLASSVAWAQTDDPADYCTGFWGKISCFLFGNPENRAGKGWFDRGALVGEASDVVDIGNGDYAGRVTISPGEDLADVVSELPNVNTDLSRFSTVPTDEWDYPPRMPRELQWTYADYRPVSTLTLTFNTESNRWQYVRTRDNRAPQTTNRITASTASNEYISYKPVQEQLYTRNEQGFWVVNADVTATRARTDPDIAGITE